jgi:ubiquinone/menaquinone biosynthesis C-methylase UbiE
MRKIKYSTTDLYIDPISVEYPEERSYVPIENLQLRRQTPKPFNIVNDYTTVKDSDVSNRTDNEIATISNQLDILDWEIENFIIGSRLGKIASGLSSKSFLDKLKSRYETCIKAEAWSLSLGHTLEHYKKVYNTYQGDSAKLVEGVPLHIVTRYIPILGDSPERPYPIGYDYLHNIKIGEVIPWSKLQEVLQHHRLASTSAPVPLIITYASFPQTVRDFISKFFNKELTHYPEIKSTIEELTLQPRQLPEEYSEDVGAEWSPENNCIFYYLPLHTLDVNSEGLVHEITHLIQHLLEEKGEKEWTFPETWNQKYRNGEDEYINDPGEVQARRVSAAYKAYLSLNKTAAFETYLKKNEELFNQRFNDYGEKGSNIFWSSNQAQYSRFEALVKLFSKKVDLSKSSILDVGCGYGDLISYLQENEFVYGKYVGIDIVESIIKIAKKKHPDNTFYTMDMFDKSLSENSFTYVIGSGIFALEDKVWEEYVIRGLQRLLQLATVGVGVNFLKGETKYGTLHYTNSKEIERIVQNITDKYKINEDYLADDLTLYMFK